MSANWHCVQRGFGYPIASKCVQPLQWFQLMYSMALEMWELASTCLILYIALARHVLRLRRLSNTVLLVFWLPYQTCGAVIGSRYEASPIYHVSEVCRDVGSCWLQASWHDAHWMLEYANDLSGWSDKFPWQFTTEKGKSKQRSFSVPWNLLL